MHVYPLWMAHLLDNPIRRLIHNPTKILGPYVSEGMIVMDIGVGLGIFSIAMAKMVGEKGTVISVDFQERMLNVLEKRAKKAGVAERIRLHRCEPDDIGIRDQVDFALTFWMAHEAPSAPRLFEQIYSTLSPTAKYLLVEPIGHVSGGLFGEEVAFADRAGFKVLDQPRIAFSRSALFGKG